MSEDILDPLDFYAHHLKAEHAKNVSAFFEKLVEKSGIDAVKNTETILALQAVAEKRKAKFKRYLGLKIILGIQIVLSLGLAIYLWNSLEQDFCWLAVVPLIIFLPFIYWVLRQINALKPELNDLKAQVDAMLAKAWEELSSLNDLFTWDIALELVAQSFPGMRFDKYFNNARIQEMHEQFGFDANLGKDHSILHTHSGSFNGNPFILAKTLGHWMGSKTYQGSLSIRWTTQRRNAEGKLETVTHHETLRASVTEPFPEYATESFIVYANEAAPELSFSRVPSKLSSLGDGKLDRFRKNRAIRKLEKKSLKSNQNFTVMANREFESLFGAEDRDNEVQFRLLFTPLAQVQMVKLLKDKVIGHGDDFSFNKNGMINILSTDALKNTDIDGNPEKFRHYDLAEIRKFFNQYHHDFMYAFYFSFAPLLTVPFYRQHRSHQEIYKDTYGKRPCFWVHESIANDYGENKFAHAESVTRNILKTTVQENAEGVENVRVTAYGFKAVQRRTYINVRGGDGRTHQVPVDWVEYLPVAESSSMLVGQENENAENALPKGFETYGLSEKALSRRRSLFSARIS
ncbi:hypothetical protein FAI41_03825 [Acetobacteraceae bacterium]|nr:hypothetical protein FAI41_03825 [Acetobacteraceae bacterium]